MTRHDCNTPDADECRTRRSAKAALSSVVSWEPAAPHVAINAQHVCHSHAIRLHVAGLRSADSHNGHIAGSVRSYRQQGDLHPNAPAEPSAGSSDAVQGHGMHGVQRHPVAHEPSRHNGDDVRGLEVSLGGLRQDLLVQGKIRNGFAKTLVLFLQTL